MHFIFAPWSRESQDALEKSGVFTRVQSADDPAVEEISWELGLGRPRVMSLKDLLTAFIRDNGRLRQETIGPTRFVRLIGAEGFEPPG